MLHGPGSVEEAHTVNESIDLAEAGDAAHGEIGGRRLRV